MDFDYDLFVIGGGSGGVRAARRAAATGARVAIAEESRWGGTCVIRGCVPKKLYVYASSFAAHFADAAGFGWHLQQPTFDWKALVASKEAEITRLENLYRQGLSSSNVELFDSRAELTGPNNVRLIAEDREVSAKRIMIAVGGHPNLHEGLEGHEHAIISDDAFDLSELPESIIIAGGGYVAVEFAGIFNGLGVETSMVFRNPHLLTGFDEESRCHVEKIYQSRGVRTYNQNNLQKLEKRGDGRVDAHLTGGEILTTDQVFIALGRLPSTQGLGLEKAGVEVDPRGYIKVDEYSRTNVDSVWAIGDVTDRVPLTPVAIHEAMCFVSTEFLGSPERPDHELIATAVFSQPEMGTVGLTEEQAGEQFNKVNVFRASFRPMRNTLAGRDEPMLLKVLVDASNDRVVGVHIVGPDSGEMAQLLAISMKMGATKADFDRTMAVHPTASEELVTMYEPTYMIENGKRVE